MVEVDISKNINAYRKMKDLTIKELANLTGVTPSLLSQIEKGTANPSINTLKQVSYALDIPLFNFFINDDSNEDLVVRSGNRRKLLSEDDSFVYELLTPNLKGAIEFSMMKIPPHKSSSKELSNHKGEEVAYVLEGSVTIYIMNSVIKLNCGDSVRIPPHTNHKWENTCDKYCEVIYAITPPTF